MKKKLRNLLAATAAVCGVGFAQEVAASHYQGSDLTYANIAPNIFIANLKLYRDCSGAPAPSTATLNVKSIGCNTGRNITMNKVGGNRIGDPYCAAIPKGCTSTGRTNYEEVVFTSVVTFSAAEAACPTWIMSWQECCRPSTANLVGQDNFYTEAMVNLGANINNNSPEFSPLNIPIPFVNYNQPIMLSLNATETDGDSLAYSLVSPLTGHNTPVPTKPYGANMIYNADSSKYALTPAGTFSSTYPIFSYHADWTQPMPITPVQKFMFDPLSGSIGFIPSFYDPNSQSAAGTNKYALAVQIDEYRNVNGAVIKVGSIRRDILINVIDCGPNQNPNIAGPVVNGQPIQAGDIIELRPGTTMNMQFAAQDGNASDVVSLTSDITSAIPGAVMNVSSGNQPTATITWTPTASQAQNRVYYFNVTAMDNACPVKGFQTHTFGVRVSATGGVTGVKELATSKNLFSAYPNPFSQELTFKLNLQSKAESLKIYNILGQQVDQIALGNTSLGDQKISWANAGKHAAGTYIAKLISADKTVQTLKFNKL